MKNQVKALETMERETRREVRRLEDFYANRLLESWFKTKIDLQGFVAREYHRDFGRKKWNAPEAAARGTLSRIKRESEQRLANFTHESIAAVKGYLASLYRTEALRQAWMLDQLTPGSRVPKLPKPRPIREAKTPRDYAAGWDDALREWISAYQDAFASNLRMSALGEDDIHDATDQVDRTKISGYDPSSKLGSMFTTSALIYQQDARDDFADENEDLIAEEIWQTMEDAAVCPICDEYDGEVYDTVGDVIPAHFNCRCYTRIVPKPWADLLRSGSSDERDLALKMDDQGMVPNAMAIYDSQGGIVGTVTVKFSDWLDGRAASFYGQNILGVAQ